MVNSSEHFSSSTEKTKVCHCKAGNEAKSGNDTVSDKQAKISPKNKSLSAVFMRLIIVFIILSISICYVSYPKWREKAEQYVAMIGAISPLTLSKSIINFLTQDSPTSSENIKSQPTKYEYLDSFFDSFAVLKKDFQSLKERLVVLETKTYLLSEIPEWMSKTKENIDRITEQIDAMESKVKVLLDDVATFRYKQKVAEDIDVFSSAGLDLSDRLSILERRLLNIEEQENFEWPLVSSDGFDILQEKIKVLRSSFEDRDTSLIAQIDDIVAAQQELKYKLEEDQNKKKKIGAFLLAIDRLQEASQKGSAFAVELDELENAAWDQLKIAEAIVILRTHVDGVPSLVDLRYSFPAVAQSIIKSTSSIGDDNDIVDKVMTRIFSLVTLRHTETDDNRSLDAIINRAEAATRNGDLLIAADYLEALVGKAAQAAQPWITAVEERFALDKAIHTLHSQALAALLGD
ncbi:hypothetical protein A1OE_949 [Candidatus Endolissoclinum faulkneri L2]|uniref:Uncharacterized protein n=1 Tax=Candidatus Endolissoclinum faulkneri L2 TaxID=1193729 RepID=K7ZD30_9PROT|nr:mitofilin family membrane protein [Candidatus Endolissoclinum faulkneri]AFX99131.1 hypothetical protein A1OE_949 [Candidatus Endolissoclinum faulkneri L2]